MASKSSFNKASGGGRAGANKAAIYYEDKGYKKRGFKKRYEIGVWRTKELL